MQMYKPMDDEIIFWDIKDVLEGAGLSRSLWYDQVRKGIAPQPVKTGHRRVAWLKHEVMEYRKSLVEERDKSISTAGYQADSTINK